METRKITICLKDEKLTSSHLSCDYIDDLVDHVKQELMEDKTVIEDVKDLIEGYDCKPCKGMVEVLIEGMAERAVDGVRIYCDFDIEVTL